MNTPAYDKDITALLVVDPYNDFMSEGGKIWPRIKAVAEANNCVAHMLEVLNAARRAKLRVFYAMHHRYRPGDYETWKYIAPVQKGTWQHRSFEFGTWGGEFRAEFVPQPGEIVAQEHWCSSGFLPEAKAKVLYAVQWPFQKTLLTGKTTHAAWRSKPSWYAVSTEDRTINPDLERFMAKRMGAKTIEVKASRLSLISHPKEISQLILEAAGQT